MIEIMLAEIFLKAFVLCGILYLVARHEADYSFQKVAMVVGGIVAGNAIIEASLCDRIGVYTLIPAMVFTAFMVITFCWVSVRRAVLVVALFTAVQAGIAYGRDAFAASMCAGQSACAAATEERHEELEEIKDEIVKNWTKPQAMAQVMPEVRCAVPVTAVPPCAPPEAPAPAAAPAASTLVAGTAASVSPEPGALAAQNWKAARTLMHFGGVLTQGDGSRLATINGRPAAVGDSVWTEYGGQIYRWRVKRISARDADLHPVDVRPVPRRGELARPPAPVPAVVSKGTT